MTVVGPIRIGMVVVYTGSGHVDATTATTFTVVAADIKTDVTISILLLLLLLLRRRLLVPLLIT